MVKYVHFVLFALFHFERKVLGWFIKTCRDLSFIPLHSYSLLLQLFNWILETLMKTSVCAFSNVLLKMLISTLWRSSKLHFERVVFDHFCSDGWIFFLVYIFKTPISIFQIYLISMQFLISHCCPVKNLKKNHSKYMFVFL